MPRREYCENVIQWDSVFDGEEPLQICQNVAQ